MPVYNVAEYLTFSVESVLSQVYDNYELILVDDGSTDKCPLLCDEYAANCRSVKVIHKMNGGQGDARNAGLNVAKGDYVYFLDSDDTILPDTLSSFVDVINKEGGDLSIIGTGFQYVSETERNKPAQGNEGYGVYFNKFDLQRKFLTREIVILAPGTLYNRDWLNKYNLRFKKVPYSEDQLFVWEALLCVEKSAFIYRTLYNYLHREGSIMTSAKFDKIKEAYPFFVALNDKINMSSDADDLVKRYMLARWCFGIYHSAAKLCSKYEYIQLLKDSEANRHVKNLLSFPDLKIKMRAMAYWFGKTFFYRINRII